MSNSDRSYRRLIRKAAATATRSMRSQRWPSASVESVQVMRFPFRSRTRVVWVIQICGKPFNPRKDILPEDCELVDYPVWLASDGQLYEVSLAGDRSDTSNASQLGKASMYDWHDRGLDGLYVLVLQALLETPSH